MTTPVLSLRGVGKRFGRGAGATVALNGVDLDVAAGEVVAVVGESGSGKTTLSKAGLWIDPPTEGTVRWGEIEPRQLTATARRAARRRYQLVYQNPFASLNPGLTVRQHLVETARVHLGASGAGAAAAAERALDRLGLTARADSRPARLSGGERRRATVARALLPDPDLLVADEPTSGLDAAVKGEVAAAIVSARDARTAVVLITHDLEVVRPLASRLVVMFAGRVVEEVRAADLGRAEHHPYTAALLRAARWEREPAASPGPLASGRLPDRPGDGCPFRARCGPARESGESACAAAVPPLHPVGPAQRVACHLVPFGSPPANETLEPPRR